MSKHAFFDQDGKPIIMGKELGKGGEGTVFELQNNSSIAAKIYFNPPDTEKASKILSMATCSNDRLLKLASWPLQSIHSRSGNVIGFLMQKLQGYHPLYELYNPKLRLQQFPKADWRFLIHTAMNTAKAFSIIHEAGHVIGDVNHGNLLVSNDSTVKFIDTDSFQISINNRHWLCEVGVGTHQPPEMQGLTSYRGIFRSANHDNFGLAVLLFQLICLGRHPFSGRYSGKGDMPIEKAIKEFRFAYSKDNYHTLMSPPPACLPMDALSSLVRSLFDRAFSIEGKEKGRPTPREWVTALEALLQIIKPCTNNSSHYYLNSLRTCPWCDIEIQSNLLLFPLLAVASHIRGYFESLWQQIISIAPPASIVSIPKIGAIQTSSSQEALIAKAKIVALKKKMLIPSILAIGTYLIAMICNSFSYSFLLYMASLASLAGCYLYYKIIKAIITKEIRKKYKLTKAVWADVINNWHCKIDDKPFKHARLNLDKLKNQYDSLQKEKQDDLQKLWKNRQQQQLNHHLDQFRVDRAQIHGIGHARVCTLFSDGIVTAADIDIYKLQLISGFGPKLIQRLMNWRTQCESSFIFCPTKNISQSDLNLVEGKIMQKRAKIEQETALGLAHLKNIKKQIEERHQQLQILANTNAITYAKALADAKELGLST